MSPAQAALAQLRAALRERFLEREVVIDGLLVALLARQHVLLFGPPGTAKSSLVKTLAEHLEGGRSFEWLLTKFTTPEELFGPVSLPALSEGRYERVLDGKLPEAELVFLDEVFKANAAILNALLTVMNERRFHQGRAAIQLPLETLIGASNELPEDEGLSAVYDRFLLRFRVDYLQGAAEFERLLSLPEAAPPGLQLSRAALQELQAEVARVDFGDARVRDLAELRAGLNKRGVVASDRRYRQCVPLLKARALLSGRAEVGLEDLSLLQHVLWSDPEDAPKVEEALAELAGGFDREAERLFSLGREVDAYARRGWTDPAQAARAVLEAHTKLAELRERLSELREAAVSRGRPLGRLDGIGTALEGLQRRLLREQN